MKKLFVLASLFVASPCLAQDVRLVPLGKPSLAWPITMRLERPHSDEAPACGAVAAIEKWSPEQPRERHQKRRRHRR